MRAYEVPAGCTSVEDLRPVERPDPSPGPHEIVIRTRAVSLNARDHAIMTGRYFLGATQKVLVPLSDGAGEVVAIGSQVSRFQVDDRAVGTFFQSWIDGQRPAKSVSLGSPLDGTLAEFVKLDEEGAIAIPPSMTFEEAATLPCAAVAAWNALFFTGRPVRPGETVVCLGTGGVSTFALQFARMAGARVIVISSSREKLERSCALGAAIGINYRDCPEWGIEVVARTEGVGAAHVMEVGGTGTIRRSCQAVAWGGKVALIGTLAGSTGSLNTLDLMRKAASVHGVGVGHRAMFEDMLRAMVINKIKPLIDAKYGFDEAAAAFQHHASGAFMGKIVITI